MGISKPWQELVNYHMLVITRNYNPLSLKDVMLQLIVNKKAWNWTQVILMKY